MKTALISLLSMIFCNGLMAQDNECKAGTDSAKVDFGKGIFRTYIFSKKEETILIKILKEEYGIDAIGKGCVHVAKLDCYSKFMNEKIKEKFGDDIFEKAQRKAEEIRKEKQAMSDCKANCPKPCCTYPNLETGKCSCAAKGKNCTMQCCANKPDKK